MKKLIFTLILVSMALNSSYAEDPFKNITLHKFKNGLKVILAPDPKSEFVQVKTNVGVGFVHEDVTNYGVSHLLEHVLFRNSKLKDDMSYLQLIQEKDGTANGTTSWDRTSYYATVKKNDGNWIVDTFHEMIMKPSMDPKHVETEKKTVLLEIGEPGPFARAIGMDLLERLEPDYLNKKDFWEEYFNVKMKSSYSRTDEQLSTLRLNKDQIRTHYLKFYDPSNMQIYVSGNFNKDAMLARLVDLYAGYPSRKIGDQRPKYKPELPKRSALNHDVAFSRPSITLGFLVGEISIREKEVLLSYMEFLSHRLMKKLRNLNGETYTVRERSNVRRNFGYVAIDMESSREKFYENLKFVREMMKKETFDGQLSNEEVEEAKRLYLNNFVHWSQNASGAGRMAERMFEMNEYEGIWETPFEILATVTPVQYKLILQKYSQTNLKYERIVYPELLFQTDVYFFIAICCLGIFIFFRRVLLRPFKNDEVRWVKKVRFPPLKSFEGIVGVIVVLACAHSFLLADKLLDSGMMNQAGVVGEYLKIFINAFVIIASAQVVVSYFPRKMYLMKDELVIKSLSYSSRSIPKSEIKSVKAVSLLKIFTSPTLWPKLWNSFFYYDIKVWKKGLLITLHSGKLFYFSTKDSKIAVEELRGLLGENDHVPAGDQKAA
jgi:zinc protease